MNPCPKISGDDELGQEQLKFLMMEEAQTPGLWAAGDKNHNKGDIPWPIVLGQEHLICSFSLSFQLFSLTSSFYAMYIGPCLVPGVFLVTLGAAAGENASFSLLSLAPSLGPKEPSQNYLEKIIGLRFLHLCKGAWHFPVMVPKMYLTFTRGGGVNTQCWINTTSTLTAALGRSQFSLLAVLAAEVPRSCHLPKVAGRDSQGRIGIWGNRKWTLDWDRVSEKKE